MKNLQLSSTSTRIRIIPCPKLITPSFLFSPTIYTASQKTEKKQIQYICFWNQVLWPSACSLRWKPSPNGFLERERRTPGLWWEQEVWYSSELFTHCTLLFMYAAMGNEEEVLPFWFLFTFPSSADSTPSTLMLEFPFLWRYFGSCFFGDWMSSMYAPLFSPAMVMTLIPDSSDCESFLWIPFSLDSLSLTVTCFPWFLWDPVAPVSQGLGLSMVFWTSTVLGSGCWGILGSAINWEGGRVRGEGGDAVVLLLFGECIGLGSDCFIIFGEWVGLDTGTRVCFSGGDVESVALWTSEVGSEEEEEEENLLGWECSWTWVGWVCGDDGAEAVLNAGRPKVVRDSWAGAGAGAGVERIEAKRNHGRTGGGLAMAFSLGTVQTVKEIGMRRRMMSTKVYGGRHVIYRII